MNVIKWSAGPIHPPLSCSTVTARAHARNDQPDKLQPVAICIPVRDEEDALPGLLDALAGLDTDGADAVACFYLDGCDDASEAMLRSAARSFPFTLRIEHGVRGFAPNAGAARRAAMAMGLTHRATASDAILLSTDADSRPSRDWIAAARDALAVADVAAGMLCRSASSSDIVHARVEHYYDRLHAFRRTVDPVPWDAAPGHHFGGGANLAVRAAAYRAIGGFRPIPAGEDATLLDEAARAGFRVRRDRAMLVETSARRIGRATGGLADALRAIDASGPPLVAHPAGAAWQYRMHAAARHAFAGLADQQTRAGFGSRIGLSGDHVLGVGRDCPNAEAFAMRIVPAAPAAPPVPLHEAEEALRELEDALCVRAA